MNRLFFYKLTADDGGAPCVHRSVLSLAICKPAIRSRARPGDVILGFAAIRPYRDNKLLYVARVTKKLTNGEYYRDKRYAKRPDCIYRYSGGKFVWRKNARYHSPKSVQRDLGKGPEYRRASVLLSTDFRYFGANGDESYKRSFSRIRRAIESLGQGHRVNHGQDLREELEALERDVWDKYSRRVLGKPRSAPSRRTSHQCSSCGVC